MISPNSNFFLLVKPVHHSTRDKRASTTTKPMWTKHGSGSARSSRPLSGVHVCQADDDLAAVIFVLEKSGEDGAVDPTEISAGLAKGEWAAHSMAYHKA